ncbi:MAG: hypothetical protein EOS23_04845 [Mesorhizobium sp.]|nr:MAG: hypothetical protein EOS23_04845 [Mesorhizobium sp.]
MLTSPYFPLLLAAISLFAGAAFVIWPSHRTMATFVFWASGAAAIVFAWLWIRESYGPIDATHMAIGVGLVVILGLVWISSQIASVAKRVSDLEQKSIAHVEPRRLSAEQKKALIDYLLPREKHEIGIVFSPMDDEASGYASDFLGALKEAGWKVKMLHFDSVAPKGRPPQNGLHVQATGNIPEKNHSEVIRMALQSAKVQTDGGGWTNAHGGEESLYLGVGRRPYTIRKPGGGWG